MFVTTKKNEVSLKLVLSCIEQLIEQGNILLGVISHFFKKKGVPFHYVKVSLIFVNNSFKFNTCHAFSHQAQSVLS